MNKKNIAEDPVLKKRLDDAAQRARDQELKIIILEKEVEALRAVSGSKKADEDVDSSDEKQEERIGSRKTSPPKPGFREEAGLMRSKDQKNHSNQKSQLVSEKGGTVQPTQNRRSK